MSENTSHSCGHCQVPLGVLSGSPGLRSWLAFPHTVSQVERAAADGCLICKELYALYNQRSIWHTVRMHRLRQCSCCRTYVEALKHIWTHFSSRPFRLILLAEPRETDFGSILISIAYLNFADGTSGPRFNAYTHAEDAAASLLPSIDLDVNSASTLRSVDQWISSCICQKRNRSNAAFTPSRLVDLGEDRKTKHLNVVKTGGLHIPSYVCLSYTWGGAQDLCCKRDALDRSGHWAFSVSELPATFHDCFTVARLLGYRYVWIDSLCIVQDVQQELEAEIELMPFIYKNAELTICASITESCHETFLRKRPDFSQFHIPLIVDGSSHGTIYLDSYRFGDPPVHEKLGSRAWAFQEWLLSPRVLEYGWRTARWTCQCRRGYGGQTGLSLTDRDLEDSNESTEYSLFWSVSPHRQRRLPRSREELFTAWATLVRTYSALKLSHQRDRLAAIGGVAQELQRITGVPYLAGLWNYEKLSSLLQWNVINSVQELSVRPKAKRAPSWSWAGIDNPVVIHYSEETINRFRIIETKVKGGFNLSAEGSITMEGPTRTMTTWSMIEKLRIGPKHSMPGASEMLTENMIIYPDCAGEIVLLSSNELRLRPSELTFVAIGRVNWNRALVRGLVLRLNQTLGTYTRLGLFQCPDKDDFAIDHWNIEVIVVE